MSFNFGLFKDMMKKFGASKKWDKSVKQLNSGIKSMRFQDESGNIITMIPKSEANTAGTIMKNFAIAQTADEAIYALSKTPVNEFFKVMTAGQVLPGKYTLGQIPGFKKVFDWINDKVLGALKWICNSVGFQGIARATDNYQQLWEKGFKAIGDSSGYKGEGGNHDSWWQAKGERVVVHTGTASFPTENGAAAHNARKTLGGMLFIKDDLATAALNLYNVATGTVNPFADTWAECIAKYLTYLNYQQTLTQTELTNYLNAVCTMYGYYISHKKYYNCRNTRIVENNQNSTVAKAYVDGSIVVSGNLGTRTSLMSQGSPLHFIGTYVADKDWQDVETFLEKQYLPKKIAEYIENMYGHFYQYKKGETTLVTIDPSSMFSCPFGPGSASSILQSYTQCKDRINTTLSNNTASIKGFLAKCGMEPVVIPSEFKDKRSKDGTQDLEAILADDTMRRAINNVFTYKNNQGYGYRFDDSADTIMIDADVNTTVKFTGNNDKEKIKLESEEANYLSKLLKFAFTGRLEAISMWGINHAGAFTTMGFANMDITWGPQNGTAAPTVAEYNRVRTLAYQWAGDEEEGSVREMLGLDMWFDGHLALTWSYTGSSTTGTVVIMANSNLATETETKVEGYSRLRFTALMSIASGRQYEEAIDKFIAELSKTIDYAL